MKQSVLIFAFLTISTIAKAQTKGDLPATQPIPPPTKVIQVTGVGKDMAYKQDKTEAQTKYSAILEAQVEAKNACKAASAGYVTYALQTCTETSSSSAFFVKDYDALKVMMSFGYTVTNSSSFFIGSAKYSCQCALYNYAPPGGK